MTDDMDKKADLDEIEVDEEILKKAKSVEEEIYNRYRNQG